MIRKPTKQEKRLGLGPGFWVIRQDNYGWWVPQAWYLVLFGWPYVPDQYGYSRDLKDAIKIASDMNGLK